MRLRDNVTYQRAKFHYMRLVRAAVKATFPVWQKLGFHVTPNHYYEPIPDTRFLFDDLWESSSDLVGIDMNEAGQLALLEEIQASWRTEYECFPERRSPSDPPWRYFIRNGNFDSVDGEMLYGLIRRVKPSRVMEIGSGFSTFLSAQALLKNAEEDGRGGELIAYEPYPSPTLMAGLPGLTRLETTGARQIPLDVFESLKPGNILFIDSTHVMRIGSDVHYEILEVLPRIPVGVLVHIHDIFLPTEYPRDFVLRQRRFWTEQYALQAFLTFNDRFEVVWAGSYMHRRHPDRLRAAFPSYDADGPPPGSLWIRRVR